MSKLDTPLHRHLHRRDLLRLAGVGSAAWLGGAAAVLGRAAESQTQREPARSIIQLWLAGGPSQLETFDPHPDTEIAAGTKAIDTTVEGIQLAEGFTHLAEQMESVSLIRSLASKEGDHERGVYFTKTGFRPAPTMIHPSVGAIACHELPTGAAEIPRHVSILPAQWPAWGGFLGAQFDAFQIGDPSGRLPDVAARVNEQRVARRLDDLKVIEQAFARGRAQQVAATRHTETVLDARRMMTSDQLAAFDVSQEPAEVRSRYGATPFGRGCLAARRLVEVGVRCVEVTLGGFDSHINNHGIHRDLVATLDPAFAALVADLRDRDLLDRTVVVCGGEFGRTPRVNRLEGRDHWPHNFAWALAGGGLAGGRVLGQTDPHGKQLDPDQPGVTTYDVADVHATVLTALGIDPEVEVTTPADRPIKLSEGHVLTDLLLDT